MNIGIIGLGYVGLTLGIAAANSGITTYGVEINPHIKACLQENHAHFYEPGLDELIVKHNNKTFFCMDKFPSDVKFDAFVITVGTPLKKGAKQPNFEYIKSALQGIKEVYTGEEVMILRSTVSVGTTRNVVLPFLAELSGKPADEIPVSMCPERTVEGKAVEELTTLPQVISGNNEKALSVSRELFSHLTDNIVEVDSLEEAELVKLYCNTYRDMTFALGNVFCMAAQQFGVDGTKIIKAANKDYKRSNIALPGFVAGPCLEKDAYILTNNMPECTTKDFIMGARHFNESLEDMVVDWVERRIAAGDRSKVVAMSGMAFKGVPETSDLRGSSSVYIAEKLYAKGYTLHFHDFVAFEDEINGLNLGTCFSSLESACNDAQLLLVLNNHPNYAAVQPFDAMKKDKFAILDTWDVCKCLRNSGCKVDTLGTVLL